MMSSAPASARTESQALGVAVWAATASAFAAVLVLPRSWIPLWSSELVSVGVVSAICVILTGAVTFPLSFVPGQRHTTRWRRLGRVRRVLDAAAVTLASACVAGLVVAIAYLVMSQAFAQLTMNRVVGAGVTGLVAGIANYGLFVSGAAVDSRRLASLLAAFLSAGVFAAALASTSKSWWWDNFSSLGNDPQMAALIFNGTLVVSGILLATLSDHLTVDLHRRSRGRRRVSTGVRVVRGLLIGVGVCIVSIGLVPERVGLVAHNAFAITALAGFFALFMLTPVLVAELPEAFRLASQCVGVALVIVVAMWAPGGYLNLTAVELCAMLMLFAWLVLLARAAATRRPE